MQIIKTFRDESKISQGSVVTIGNFDGIHLGHQALINKAVRLSRNLGLESIVVTFDPHPIEVINPSIEFEYISSLDDDTDFLENLGVDKLIVIPFSNEVSSLSAEQFLSVLFDMLSPQIIVVGTNHRFGNDRQGDIDTLLYFAECRDIMIKIVEPVQIDGQIVSSTRIRSLIKEGYIEKANKMLGRNFRLSGRVVQGAKRGVSLGFPTANLVFHKRVLPSPGVYSTISRILDKKYKSATYIGKSPTFAGKIIQVETHIMGFNQYIYNQTLKVDFVAKIRDDIQFNNRIDLVKQIRQDVREAETQK